MNESSVRPSRLCSSSTISQTCFRNHGSIGGHLVDLLDGVAALEGKADVAEALRIRRDQPLRNQLLIEHFGSRRLAGLEDCESPLPSACLNVRPIAITSPTDFICVPSTGSAPGNFSNCQRGIFATT